MNNVFTSGNDLHLRVEVIGDRYSVFVNGATTPATTLVTSEFSSGRVALYTSGNSRFDNVRLYDQLSLEAGLAGRTVFLDANANGLLDDGERTTVTRTDDPATTNANETGDYEFLNVDAGPYEVLEVPPAGWSITTHDGTRFAARGELRVNVRHLNGLQWGNAGRQQAAFTDAALIGTASRWETSSGSIRQPWALNRIPWSP